MLGVSINKFGNDLPKKIDVLRRYYGFARNISESKKISEMLREIQIVYANAGVATIHPEHVRVRLKALIKPAKAIISTRKLPTENQKKKELEFLTYINSPFDISLMERGENSPSTSIHATDNIINVRSNLMKIMN